jgi:5-methylthioribose kinase
MREVTPENAVEYLRETGRVDAGRRVHVKALGWGVSNLVMRVDVEGELPFVLKQARARLRTQAHWVSRLDRVWNERAAMECIAAILPEGVIPRVRFVDEDNFLFAMTCAPDDSVVWKEQLLAGEADPAVAHRAGVVLGTVHRATRAHPVLTGRLADTEVFDQLRIEPFYRTIARVHPSIAGRIAALIVSMPAAPSHCLVLADFSPKNILVHSRGLTLVDFETAHAGDPAFDLGFFLSHLLLKAVRAARNGGRAIAEPYLAVTASFRDAYGAVAPGDDLGLDRRASAHAAACALARIDGTSPVDYLDTAARDAVRRFALTALAHGPEGWDRLVEHAERDMLG